MSQFRIQRTRKAPVPATQKARTNTWQDLFDSMNKGHWFLVQERNLYKVRAAAHKHVKGKYRLYKHPTRKDCHVFMIKEK